MQNRLLTCSAAAWLPQTPSQHSAEGTIRTPESPFSSTPKSLSWILYLHLPKSCIHQRHLPWTPEEQGDLTVKKCNSVSSPSMHSLFFFSTSLKKVAEINGEQRNKKKPQLWPTLCLLLKGEGTLPKEEEKNVLRHNGSKGQAANRATLYC